MILTEDLRLSILQAAVEGKLTEQSAKDTPVETTLDRLQDIKNNLANNKKIKKAASKTEDSIPFNIPDNWTWVKLCDIGELARGKSKHRPRNDESLYIDGTIPMIQTGDVAAAHKYITQFNTCYNEKGLAQSRLWKKRTLCITIAASTIEETPFDIPDSWKFIRMGEAITLLSGQDFTSDKYSDIEIPNGTPYLTGASNIENGKVIINRWTNHARAIAYKNDLLVTCKGTIGAMALLPIPKAHIARQIMAIHPLGNIDIFYIKYCIENFILAIRANAKSAIPGIDRKIILNLIIPLPPFEEQQRIVEQLDELLPLCDSLVTNK